MSVYFKHKKAASPRLRIAYRALVPAAVLLALLLVAGTLYGLLRDAGSPPLFTLGGGGAEATGDVAVGAKPSVQTAAERSMGGDAYGLDENGNYTEGVFTGIGRLRIPLAGQNAAAVLSVVFPYPAADRGFSEELAARLGEMRQITGEYFGAFSAESLRQAGEPGLKSALLSRYNALLRLGKIEALYFNDFVILD